LILKQKDGHEMMALGVPVLLYLQFEP